MMKKYFNIIIAAALVTLSACHKAENARISQPVVQAGNIITSDTLSGNIKGTLLSGKTYYFASNITVNGGDTLLMQPGSKLIALGDGLTYQTAPEIFVHGTFISLGTQDQQNYITVSNAATLHSQAAQQNYTGVFQGWWGGIFCTPGTVTAEDPTPAGGDFIIKWTHLEFAGGPAGPDDVPSAVYAEGDPRWTIYFGNITKNFIMEDSWIFGSRDDGMRVAGGHIDIMRNTYELCGVAAGEACNIKSGSVGDVAYNMIIGAATNAFKISDAGSTGIQCNINCYNNTLVNCGFRQNSTSGHGGSIDFEKAAKGNAYNNMIINCAIGLRVLSSADTANVLYNNQIYYGYSQTIVNQFDALDGKDNGKQIFHSADIYSAVPQQNNPVFYGFDVNAYDYNKFPAPATANDQTPAIVMVGTSSFRLQATSPAVGKAKTDFASYNTVTAIGGNYGATITLPGKDMGAYQSDGTGNQH
jgi:hypothetical protein